MEYYSRRSLLCRLDDTATRLLAHYAAGQHFIESSDTHAWVNIDSIEPGSFPYGFMGNLHRFFNADLLREHPFVDKTFDGALCEDFIEHLTEPQLLYFLSEARRTMRPNGSLILSWPSWERLDVPPWGDKKQLAFAARDRFLAWHYHRCGHVCLYDEAHVLRLATAVGWEFGTMLSDAALVDTFDVPVETLFSRSTETNIRLRLTPAYGN